MNKIGIVAGVYPGLPQNILNENQIEAIDAKLDWPELAEQTGQNTFEKMREIDRKGLVSFGKTSQPSPKNFLDAYQRKFDEGYSQVICINVTSKLSGTHNSALQAIKYLPEDKQDKIFVFDTLSASVGQGMFVLKAVELIKQGRTAEEVIAGLNQLLLNLRTFIVFENLKWLEKSGRISSLASTIASKMAQSGIRPLMSFVEGKLKPVGVKMGVKEVAQALFLQFKKENEVINLEGKTIKIAIAHGDDMEGAQKLKRLIEEGFPQANVLFINMLHDLIGTIAGPNTLAVAWYVE
ncbi:MAG: DegV family protein [Patescibacteria group bacterium]